MSRLSAITIVSALALAGACSSTKSAPAIPHGNDASCTVGAPGPTSASGLTLAPFCAPNDPGGGGVIFAASGEALAIHGYDFPPAQPDDAAFVDGWEVKFSRLLVTVDKITLSSNPDKSPSDESQTDGVVAEADGPWAIDLSRSDPRYLAGKGGAGEEAVPIAALAGFPADHTRYAFGFDVVAATRAAQNVNIDAAGLDAYGKMIDAQCTILYAGTATFKGDKTDASCYPPEKQSWPDVVDFELCFKSPASYLNCQNPDNDPAGSFPNDEHARGIALLSSQSVIGQITIHTDHPFWDSVLHDSPAHFDQFAARVVGAAPDAGTPLVTLEMTKGVDYTEYTDALGSLVHWRYCIDPPTDVHPKLTGFMKFDAESVPHVIGGDPASGLRDYADFSTYDQSTQGHLNSDGLCFVKRNYPSPP